jgi:transcriptional regulator with XRE-family HTH domain
MSRFHFGYNLKQLREKKNFSKSELSKIMGVSRQFIMEYENKEDVPPIKTLIQFSEALSVNLLDLMAPIYRLIDIVDKETLIEVLKKITGESSSKVIKHLEKILKNS